MCIKVILLLFLDVVYSAHNEQQPSLKRESLSKFVKADQSRLQQQHHHHHQHQQQHEQKQLLQNKKKSNETSPTEVK
jgi:hypothetical protein